MRTEGFPRVYGPYLLLSSLGRGGMGEVFLGKRHAIGDVDRLCIVKTLRGDLSEHQEYVRRFLDEARVVVQLNHAHICQVYETGRVGAEHCLAMEYIAGVNVKDLALDLARQSALLDPGLALYVISCVLDALAYAHRFQSPITGAHLRVVHRDVSPANVMVSFDGDVKLIDFGLAESSLKTEQTETRLVMGKVAYMAPEQARGEDVDGTVDQFAAGVMLYELLSGERFYGDMNTHQIWQIVGRGGHVPARWLDVPDALRSVVARALDPLPTRRFPSCDAMRDALDELRARHYPRANKGQLRELLGRLYGDRAAAERDLIASFSDLRAPAPDDTRATTPEVTASSQRPTAEPSDKNASPPRTEPWRNSPSSSDVPVASGVVGVAVRAPQPEVTVSSPSASATLRAPARAPQTTSEPSEPLVVPPSVPTHWWGAAALALVVVLSAGWLALRTSAAPDMRVTAQPTPPSNPTVPAAKPEAGAAEPTPAHADASDQSAPAAIDRRDARRAAREERREERREARRAAAAPLHGETPPAPPAPPPVDPPADPQVLPSRTLAEDYAIVQRCARPCAADVIRLVERAGGDTQAKATIIRHCAEACISKSR